MGIMPRWLHRVRNFLRELEEDNVRAFAAQSAYFLMLSSVPLLMLVTVILQIFLNHTNIYMQLDTWQLELLPAAVGSFLTKVVNEVSQNVATILPVSLLMAVWASSKGMAAITQGLNSVYGVEESRNYIISFLHIFLHMLFLRMVSLLLFLQVLFLQLVSQLLF